MIKRLYECSELKNGNWGIFKDKYYSDSDTIFFKRYGVVSTEDEARKIVNELNILNDKNEQLKSELKALKKKYNDFSNMVEKRLKEMDIEMLK